jgi:hypothetical protein
MKAFMNNDLFLKNKKITTFLKNQALKIDFFENKNNIFVALRNLRNENLDNSLYFAPSETKCTTEIIV